MMWLNTPRPIAKNALAQLHEITLYTVWFAHAGADFPAWPLRRAPYFPDFPDFRAP